MKKLLRKRDILLLTLAGTGDLMEEMKDPLHLVSSAYKNMYGFVPRRYKKHNFLQTIGRNLKTGDIEKVVKEGKVYLRLTSAGRDKVKRDFPITNLTRKWNKHWTIIVFDIEEKFRVIRDSLREKLRNIGFGMLQESVFITPNDIVRDFSEFVESYNLEDSVYILEVSQIVGGDVKSLVNKIWHLDELDERYIKILNKIRKLDLTRTSDRPKQFNNPGKEDKEKLLNFIKDIRKEYLEILLIDPFLPKELLPENWQGREARISIKNLEKLKLVS